MFHFDLSSIKDQIRDKEELTYKADFWNDTDTAQKIMQDIKRLNNEVKRYEDLVSEIEEVEIMLQLMEEVESYEDYKEIPP